MIGIIFGILLGFLIYQESWISVIVLLILFLNEVSQGALFMSFEEMIGQKTRIFLYAAAFLS
ncbi:MAG: hypothetical protein GF368_01085 [Candidatus Aenigmarchaeota archaeon]|nr:hypothetical protein [Candidatus Aenigmarchaeota archaeon]